MPRTKRAACGPRDEPPSTTFEGREQQMVNLATNLAEQRLRDGTAPSQLIVHYLRLGTTRERLEQERLRQENEMLRAKTEAIESQRHFNDFYEEALRQFRIYSGSDDYVDYDEHDD